MGPTRGGKKICFGMTWGKETWDRKGAREGQRLRRREQGGLKYCDKTVNYYYYTPSEILNLFVCFMIIFKN